MTTTTKPQAPPDTAPPDTSNHETPLSQKAPGSPFALVALSYLALLLLAALAFATVYWLLG
ncbi:hypothetical protein Mal15_22990 [Stieleria maiorica]|uniref:Uncharacterized protein n=1 Tax=Stieleria maiorica TaxID=2795974 RepID=A0A5B9ME49_9BACT|nr:hypothetical protein [Stieleria maiorica]QEF98250.1 hypothetical protein Mal15_22990 [Stieleria maiorica]